MLSMIIWLFAFTGSLSVVSLAVAFDARGMHLTATALISLGIVAMAVSEHRAAAMEGASEWHLAAIASRYMGLLWGWSAVSAYVVYGFLLVWPFWLQAVTAMLVLCATFVFAALVLDRETEAERPDSAASALIGLLAKAQFAIGAILFGALLAWRGHPMPVIGGTGQWVAFNLFLCSAAALMTLTGYLIQQARPISPTTDTAR